MRTAVVPSLLVLVAVSFATTPVFAAGLYFDGVDLNPPSNSQDVNVQAYFSDVTEGIFTLTLKYISGTNVDNAGVLTGFLWTYRSDMGAIELAVGPPDTVGVVTGPDTHVLKKNGDDLGGPGTSLNVNWAYSAVDPTGVGAAGGTLFGTPDVIGTDPPSDNPPIDGVDFGLVPYTATFGNGLSGGAAKSIVKSTVEGTPTSVIFTFEVVGGTLNPSNDIASARFTFGSDLFQIAGTRRVPPPLEQIPEPVPAPSGIMALLSLALLGGGYRFRQRLFAGAA